jgi:erythromycin esterase-like protein
MSPLQAVSSALTPIQDVEDCQTAVDRIGDAEFALLGESSHGTHEFYAARAAITKKLILESGFRAVAIEGDWPDAYRVNCYVQQQGNDKGAVEALSDFKRFPTWMWRNTVVVEFVEWLRDYNDGLPREAKVGFYGMDLYALYGSIRALIAYLQKVDPAAAARARGRFSCFEVYGEDSQAYGYASASGMGSCEDEVVRELMELQRRAGDYASRDGRVARDDYFAAEQNARLIKDAEEYYRTMYRGGAASWNLRDRHMVDTLTALRKHLSDQGAAGKIVVWAHNSHLGDARATEMGRQGELNVGQVIRQQYGARASLIGMTTSIGLVTAASDWDAPLELKRVRPAMSGSYERLFHEAGVPRFFLPLDGDPVREALKPPQLERAIGVIYRPDTERASHYFYASLPFQFDAVLHFDHTTAVRPLEVTAEQWSATEVPETYPTGF